MLAATPPYITAIPLIVATSPQMGLSGRVAAQYNPPPLDLYRADVAVGNPRHASEVGAIKVGTNRVGAGEGAYRKSSCALQ